MPVNNSSVNALMDDFGKQTEEKAPGNGFEVDFDTPEENFASAPNPEPTPVNNPQPVQTAGEKLQDAAFEAKETLSPETQATLIVGAVDLIQQTLLAAIHKYKATKELGGKDERIKAVELMEAVGDGIKQLDDLELPDRAKVRLMQRMKKKVDALPFEDNEYDQLEQALTLILKEMPGYQLSPGAALALAVTVVMAPRIADVITD